MSRSALLTASAWLVLAAWSVPALAQQSASTTSGSAEIAQPAGAVTEQAAVTGAITLPLVTNIGASAASVALPPPTGFAGLSSVRIGTESVGREIAQIVGRADERQASFTIIGPRDQIISIAVPQTVSLLQLNGAGEVEFVTITSLSGGSGGGTRLLTSADGSGALAFDVGGAVQPNPEAVSGNYAGVLIVAVQYN